MSKHTPGPWRSVRDKEVCEILIKSKKGRKFIASLDLHSLKTGTEENCANAHLIAAAPEMLEALKIAREHVLSICEHNERVNGIDRSHMDRNDLEKIDSAIAKAEGKQ